MTSSLMNLINRKLKGTMINNLKKKTPKTKIMRNRKSKKKKTRQMKKTKKKAVQAAIYNTCKVIRIRTTLNSKLNKSGSQVMCLRSRSMSWVPWIVWNISRANSKSSGMEYRRTLLGDQAPPLSATRKELSSPQWSTKMIWWGPISFRRYSRWWKLWKKRFHCQSQQLKTRNLAKQFRTSILRENPDCSTKMRLKHGWMPCWSHPATLCSSVPSSRVSCSTTLLPLSPFRGLTTSTTLRCSTRSWGETPNW